MRDRYSLVIFVVTLLLLPSCFSSKKTSKKKSSRHHQDAGSIFTSVSESAVREDVREQYALSNSDEKKETISEKKQVKLSKEEKRIAAIERARELEAKLVDVPIPLNVEPIDDFFSDNCDNVSQALTLGYNTKMTVDEAAEFYQQEMERFGWRCLSSFNGPELLSNFAKPGKVCSVSIRPSVNSGDKHGSADIVIFSGPVA